MKIFDTHVHYDDQAFDQDREAVITGLNGENVANITNIGFDLESSRSTVELTKKYPFIYGAVGIIPEHAHEGNEENLAEIEKLASENEKVCAIGEIGLDYHYDDGPSKEKQAEVFLARMDIARRLGLPIAIHSRDAPEDTLNLMKKAHAEEIGGVMHCYSYSWETAEILLKMGFYFGIGGVVTFKNSKKLKRVVENLPIGNIVLETDGPYLSPDPFRGKRNDSSRLKYVVEKIAELKNMDPEEVARITFANAVKMYGLEGSQYLR